MRQFFRIALAISGPGLLFGGVSLKDEKELGRKFDVMVRFAHACREDPEVKHYVENLLARLVNAIPPQPFTFKSTVIMHNALNAFAVPGGYVLFSAA